MRKMKRKSNWRPPYGFTIEQQNTILELLREGKTKTYVAKLMGSSRQKIGRFLLQNKISIETGEIPCVLSFQERIESLEMQVEILHKTIKEMLNDHSKNN